jgi:hypothetical protein
VSIPGVDPFTGKVADSFFGERLGHGRIVTEADLLLPFRHCA